MPSCSALSLLCPSFLSLLTCNLRPNLLPETLPPLSIYTPPSSHPSLLQLLPLSLSQPPPPPTTASTSSPSSSPSSVLADTSILIVLDWTKPATMIVQLLGWLEWVEEWSKRVSREVEGEEGRERCTSRRFASSFLLLFHFVLLTNNFFVAFRLLIGSAIPPPALQRTTSSSRHVLAVSGRKQLSNQTARSPPFSTITSNSECDLQPQQQRSPALRSWDADEESVSPVSVSFFELELRRELAPSPSPFP